MQCQICLSDHDPNDVCDTLTPFNNVAIPTGTAIMGLPDPAPQQAERANAADIAAELAGESPPPGASAPRSAPPLSSPAFLHTPRPSGPVTPFPPGPDDADALLGKVVSGYRISQRLGKGGMGTVYLAENPTSGAKVAVKFLHPHLSADPGLVQRFYAEARAVNLIGHENILNIFDMSVLDQSRFYLVMEYLEGQPLTDLCRGPVDPLIALPILIQACDALSAAHVRGVVHRDLKPENIFLIRRSGNPHFVKIVDFGIAKLHSPELRPDQTSAGAIIGTPDFMSPEQCGGEAVDGRADLYSMGIITYLLLGGELPFKGKVLTDLLIAHRSEAPKRLPNVSATQWNIIATALKKDPKDRYQRAEDMRDALQSALRELKKPGTSVTPLPIPSTVAPTIEPPRERRIIPARHEATYPCGVIRHDSGARFDAQLSDLSNGGAFVRTEASAPPQFARVTLDVKAGAATLNLTCEVVRHVTHEQATAWGMEPGFGVQFVQLTTPQRDAVRQLLAGLPVKAEPTAKAESPDPAVSESLQNLFRRLQGDHYYLLGLGMEADFPTIRVKGRELTTQLDALRSKGLTGKPRQQLDAATTRLNEALETMLNPARRAEYDARRGNYKGVVQCLAAGLTATELQNLRNRFITENGGSVGKAHVLILTAAGFEKSGGKAQALDHYEKALALDPLNLDLLRRYETLRRGSPVQRSH